MSSTTASSMIKTHFVWQYRLFAYFMRHVAKTALMTAMARVLAMFAQLFSLFFPLNVILMLGSDAVPDFVQGDVSSETRTMWIAGLTIATLFLYIAHMLLDVVAVRLSRRGATTILRLQAKPELLPKNTRDELSILFASACQCYANGIVFVVCAAGILVLSPVVFLAMAALMLVQLLLINGLFAVREGWLGRVRNAFVRTPVEYLSYLSALNFLCVFLLQLLEYLLVGTINPVSAILTLLLARRMSRSLNRFAMQAARLQRAHDAVVGDGGVKFS